MAIAFDAVTSDRDPDSANIASKTISHTCTGSDRLLLVGVSIEAVGELPNEPSGVTYAGTNMTLEQEHTDGTDGNFAIWSLVAPDTGANDVVVTFGASADDWIIGAISFTGVDQSTPLGTPVTASGSSGAPSVSVTVASDEVMFAGFGLGEGDTGAAIDSPSTSRWIHASEDADSAAGTTGGGGTRAGTGGSTTIAWTTAVDEWAAIGVAIKPAGAAANPKGPLGMPLHGPFGGPI